MSPYHQNADIDDLRTSTPSPRLLGFITVVATVLLVAGSLTSPAHGTSAQNAPIAPSGVISAVTGSR